VRQEEEKTRNICHPQRRDKQNGKEQEDLQRDVQEGNGDRRASREEDGGGNRHGDRLLLHEAIQKYEIYGSATTALDRGPTMHSKNGHGKP